VAHIKIHPLDTEEQAKGRHEQIVKRLAELGKGQVEILLRVGGLPTNWDPIIYRWLSEQNADGHP
jgi:hypothetical protein